MPKRDGFRWLDRQRVTADVDDELSFHLDMMTRALEDDGWTHSAAEAEARRRFGDMDYTRQFCSQQDLKRYQRSARMALLSELRQDVRFTVRSLRKVPAFTIVVLLTLALGIGANTAIFSVVRGVLLEPLPFANSDRLVRIWHENRASGVSQGRVSEPDFLDWRRESRLAESMGAFFYMDALSTVDLTGDGQPQSLSSARVAEGFFETLGAAPLYGRTLNHDDQVFNGPRVVVLGYDLFKRQYNADPSIVGRSIQIAGQSHQVVGVMPEHFAYPAERSLDVWLPLALLGPDYIGRARRAAFQGVVARLRPGVTMQQLQQELNGIAARIAEQNPENKGWETVTVMPLRDSIVGNVSRPLALLFGGVMVVLLIACANVASLMLARTSQRERELAVRAALGAGRGRIARQLLTESLMLAVGGAGLGALLAVVLLPLMTASGLDIPRASLVRIDASVLIFAMVLGCLVGVLFGIVPAVRATGASLDKTLRAGGRGSIGSGLRLRRGLVIGQVALSVILVIAAGLTIKSFARLQSIPLGFNPENALVVQLRIGERYDAPDAGRAYYQALIDAIQAVPGVETVGAIRDLPTRGIGEGGSVQVSGRVVSADAAPQVQYHQVSSGYFATMGIPLLRGRTFDTRDRQGAQMVAIIDSTLASRLFPGEDATVHALRFGTTDVPIVGVVGSVRQSGPAQPLEPQVYLHAQQMFRSRMNIVVRTTGSPTSLLAPVRDAIWRLDPQQTLDVSSFEQIMGQSLTRPRFLAALFTTFGVLGLLLGAVGVYGLLAFSVNQRRQELGVRLALGAPRRAVLGMLIRQGVSLAAIGTVVGVLGAFMLTRVIQAVLFGIDAVDPVTFVQVAVVVLVTATAASGIPAWRGMQIDPAGALRNE